MNDMRRSPKVMQAIIYADVAATRKIKALKELVLPRPKFPPPQSPLGTSNYDALDLEDEIMEDGESSSDIYSDFRIMKPTTADGDRGCDYLDELDDIPCKLPQLPDAHLVDNLGEKGDSGRSVLPDSRRSLFLMVT